MQIERMCTYSKGLYTGDTCVVFRTKYTVTSANIMATCVVSDPWIEC